MRKKVVGIGGVFFKASNPDKIKEWYQQNLGMNCDEHGVLFESLDVDDPNSKTYLQWSPFPAQTDYFKPSDKEFMINYRVVDIELLIEDLRAAGVTIVDDIETYPYGKFVHILDPDNNKIELWEAPANTFENGEK
nr:VOC family protein [uncultured Carboxylicivirga sp.]